MLESVGDDNVFWGDDYDGFGQNKDDYYDGGKDGNVIVNKTRDNDQLSNFSRCVMEEV